MEDKHQGTNQKKRSTGQDYQQPNSGKQMHPQLINDGSVYSNQQISEFPPIQDNKRINPGNTVVSSVNNFMATAKEFDAKLQGKGSLTENFDNGEFQNDQKQIDNYNSANKDMGFDRSPKNINLANNQDYRQQDISKEPSFHIRNGEARDNQFAEASENNSNAISPHERFGMRDINQNLYSNLKIHQKKQLLKRNFHQDLDAGGAGTNDGQATSLAGRTKMAQRSSEVIVGNAAMVQNTQRGNDLNDGVNMSLKQMIDNQSINFDQSLPIKFEDDTVLQGNNGIPESNQNNQQDKRYLQLPSNSFEQSLDAGLRAPQGPDVEQQSLKSESNSINGPEELNSNIDTENKQPQTDGTPINTKGSDQQRKNIFSNFLKRNKKFHKENEIDQKINRSRGRSVVLQKFSMNNLELQANQQGLHFEKIDLQKPCLVKVLVCEGKIKLDQDKQEFYKIDPQLEIKYKGTSYLTKISRVGIFFPVFNDVIQFTVDNYDEQIELNLYILAISHNVPVGEPINKWINLFKVPSTEEKKENYGGRIRMKIAAANTDNLQLVQLINDKNYLLKTKIISNKGIRHNSVLVESQNNLASQSKDNSLAVAQKFEPEERQINIDDSLKTDSSQQALQTEKYSCSDHSHSHEDEDHDMVLLGLSQPRRKIDKKSCILYPDDKFAMMWEGFISVVLLTSCFTTPISLAFPNLEEENHKYRIFQIVIDLIFLMEIFLNFRYAYEDDTYQIIDEPKQISKKYLKGWFAIDVTSIFPIDIILPALMNAQDTGRGSKANQFIRMSRIGKLYKLVKVTRLLRLIKMAQKKGNLMNQIGQQFQLGEGFERLLFSIVIFIIFSHFSACFWIFTAGLSITEKTESGNELSEEVSSTSWISSGEYTELSAPHLYTTSFYFTITTMTTVGYGDISGTNTSERIVCCILMIMGVLFFTYVSGTITNIITNEEEENKIYQEKKINLNKLYKKHGKSMRPELYIELLHCIQFSTNNDQEEFNDFIETLPTKLKNECILLIHRPTYSVVTYLQYKPKQFLAWICPKLKPQLVQQDQYVYMDNENVEGVYFIVRGACAYVLKEQKQRQNIVYIEISTGDDFGQVDIISFAVDNQKNIHQAFELKDLIRRQFNCQTLTEAELMLVDMDTLYRMMHEFYEGFEALFTDADIRLRRILKQKLRAINLSEKGQIENDHQEQFKIRFKDLERNQKVQDDKQDEEKVPTKLNNHIHEKSNECNGNILFFKQSIPIKRLLERSLSDTMQISNNQSDSESSVSAETNKSNQPINRRGTTFKGLVGLFKQNEPNKEKGPKIKTLKDLILKTTSTMKEEQNHKGQNNTTDIQKLKKFQSEKKKKTAPLLLDFKDDNKENIKNKLQALSDQKERKVELLSKNGNPLLQKLAQSLKEKVETQRSNIIHQNSDNQSKDGKSIQNSPINQIIQNFTLNFGQKNNLNDQNNTLQDQKPQIKAHITPEPIKEEHEPTPLQTEGPDIQTRDPSRNQTSQIFEKQQDPLQQSFQDQQQQDQAQAQFQNIQFQQNSFMGSGIVGQSVYSQIGLNQPSVLGGASNKSLAELQAPAFAELQAQMQQQQMLHQTQMIKNMGVMYQTLNMMEEQHLNQMNEMRSQINALSKGNVSSQGSQLNYYPNEQGPLTSIKKQNRKTEPYQDLQSVNQEYDQYNIMQNQQIDLPSYVQSALQSQQYSIEVGKGLGHDQSKYNNNQIQTQNEQANQIYQNLKQSYDAESKANSQQNQDPPEKQNQAPSMQIQTTIGLNDKKAIQGQDPIDLSQNLESQQRPQILLEEKYADESFTPKSGNSKKIKKKVISEKIMRTQIGSNQKLNNSKTDQAKKWIHS